MTIIADVLAATPAAPVGGSKKLTIKHDLTGGDNRITAILEYTFSDGSVLTHSDFVTYDSDPNVIANALTKYSAAVSSTYTMFTS